MPEFIVDEAEVIRERQQLQLECLRLAVEFHKGNPNVTFTGGKIDVVFRTADNFLRYVKEPR